MVILFRSILGLVSNYFLGFGYFTVDTVHLKTLV